MGPNRIPRDSMSRFQVDEATLGPWSTVELRDALTGAHAAIALHGATLLTLQVPHAGAVHEVAAGYRDAGELQACSGSRFAVMAPFANRVADARYRFEGAAFDLQPGTSRGRGIRHGYVRSEPFEIVSLRADEDSAAVTLGYRGLRPGAHPGWPFAVDLDVDFRLHEGGLDLTFSQHNVGDRAAPSFVGWHPYFRVGDEAVDGWELKVPARYCVLTDADLVPLSGDEAYAPLDQQPAHDFRQWRAIGEAVLDVAYAGLQADADGRIRSRLRNPDSGLELRLWQSGGVMLAFTGDALPDRARKALALEPMEAMTDAFNREECREAVTLEPGAVRVFRCGVEVDPA
jgi:aldose 1-epimerase